MSFAKIAVTRLRDGDTTIRTCIVFPQPRDASSASAMRVQSIAIVATAFGLAHGLRVPTPVTPRHAVVSMSAQPPPGFDWGLDTKEASAEPPSAARATVVDMAAASEPEAAAPSEAAPEEKKEAYFCNADGCWVAEQVMCDETGCWIEDPSLETPVTLPDGRSFSFDIGVESHTKLDERGGGGRGRVVAPQGIFAPAVIAAVDVMGRKELNKLRGDVIAKHSKVIGAFVDTSESAFGQIVLKRMFEAADKDDSGGLDREEVREALHALGFKFIKDKEINKIFERGDLDGNEVITRAYAVHRSQCTQCTVHRSSCCTVCAATGHRL